MEKEKKLPDDYYDVGEIVIEKVMETASISEIFYIKDLQQRKLFIDENIMPETVGDSIRHIMQGGHNAFHPDLPQHGKRDVVPLAKPSPSFFHSSYSFN